MALVSVVVPVYNTCNFLSECVESLRALELQTDSIEIILVDDGSIDGSGEMCDGYALRDCRIRVVHQKNKGVSAARNAGINVACGDYLMFVDSDDFVHPDIVQNSLDIMRINQGDMAFCGVGFASEQGVFQRLATPPLCEAVTGEELFLRMYFGEITSQTAGLLIRREAYGSTWFPGGISYGEDRLVCMNLLLSAKKVVINSLEPMYFYRVREGSAVHLLNNDKLLSALTVTHMLLLSGLKHFEGAVRRDMVCHCIYTLFVIEMTWVMQGYIVSPDDVNHIKAMLPRARVGYLTSWNFRSVAAYVLISLPFMVHVFMLQVARVFLLAKKRFRRS